MGLIGKTLNDELDILVGDMFALNRLIDRMVSVLDVQFTMKNCVKFVHPKIAHAFPALADQISEYQSSRNELTIYPQTPIGSEDYSTVSEIFEVMCGAICKVEENIKSVIKASIEQSDITTETFLRGFLMEYSKYVEQALIFKDKTAMYGDTPFAYTQLDANFEDFMIV